jgi:O-antigen/teichoic acid export membrane protein
VNLGTRLETAVVGARRAAETLRLNPFDTSTPEGRGRERHRRVVLSAIATAFAKFVSVATALISVPLTLNYLGSERYGMWMTMSSLIAMFSFADLGMGHGIMSVVAQLSGTANRGTVRSVASSGFFALSAIAALILIAFSVLYPFVSWPDLFNVKSVAARSEAGPALAVVVMCFALAIPLAVVARIQMGLQQSYAASLWRCLGNVLGLIGVLFVIWLEGGLPWLVIAFLGGPIVASIINTIHFFGVSEPDLAPQLKFISRPTVVRIATIGSLFFGLQIAIALSLASDNIIIAQKLGAEAVTHYAVPEKMFNLIGLVTSMVLFPLWPAYGEALARGDRDWVRKTLLRSLSAAVVTTAGLSVILVIFGARIIALWTGPGIDPPFLLLLGFGIWKVMEAGGNAVSMFLNGANVFQFQLLLAALLASVAIILKLTLVTRIGIAGVIWATILADLVTIPWTFWFVRRWLREK